MRMPANGLGKRRIGVLGAGSWGTALAQLLAAKGHDVDLWCFEAEVKEEIERRRENSAFLPGFRLSERITACNEFDRVVVGKDLLVVVVPSHVFRSTVQQAAPDVGSETVVVTATKGIEAKTHMTMTAILREVIPQVPEQRICALSGPSFAREVANQVPTLVTVACPSLETAATVQGVFATSYFRVYTNHDPIGVELAGAVKNVMAIAAGISDGLLLGSNTRAALVTRGLVEIRRLGLRLGADPRTFTGLAGMGDLVLTCTDEQSRNHTVGRKIGQGMKLQQILSHMRMVAEGVNTARSVYNLSRELGVEMPIAHQVYRILHEDLDPRKALHELMTRVLKHEMDET